MTTPPTPPGPTGSTTTAPATGEVTATGPTSTGHVATGFVATGSVETGFVATEPVSAPLLPGLLATSSVGKSILLLSGLQSSITQAVNSQTEPGYPLLLTAGSSLPAPDHLSPGIVSGSPALEQQADFGTVTATFAATVISAVHPAKPDPAVQRQVAAPQPIPQLVPDAPPPSRTAPPIGGGAAAAGSGGLGSAAPPAAPGLSALALVLATILLARFSLDLARWRSTLLASRLERPG
jgi:hypothetical protein